MHRAQDTAAPSSIGWYGKLPGAGDFLGRRLPSAFIQPWDRWLQDGLTRCRATRSDQGGRHDLHGMGGAGGKHELDGTGGAGAVDGVDGDAPSFPHWRFLLPPGLIGASGWRGVILPSVDSVGRRFPLTICEPVAVRTTLPLRRVEEHLRQFVDAGLDALEGLTIAEFDRRLCALKAVAADDAVDAPDPLEDLLLAPDEGCWALRVSMTEAFARLSERLVPERLYERSLWWVPPQGADAGCLRVAAAPFTGDFCERLLRVAPGSVA